MGLMDRFKGERQSLKPCKCGSTEIYAKGLCRKCYQKERHTNITPEAKEKRRKQQREWANNKWATDEDFKKKRDKANKKYKQANPEKTKKWMRTYMERNPTGFATSMARHWLKRLTHKERLKLIEELKNEPKRAKPKA